MTTYLIENAMLGTQKAESALRYSEPKITISGTFTDATLIKELEQIWTTYSGGSSVYKLYESVKRYENQYGQKSELMISKWKKGTLRRDTKINDWLNSYLMLEESIVKA